MSGPLLSFLAEVKNFIPWVSFVAGVGGSLHCVGMCGGLVAASCERSGDVFRYQLGRLIGYLTLGAAAGLVGIYLNLSTLPAWASVAPALFIGVLFIYWGVQNFRGRKAEFPVPKVWSKAYSGLWGPLVQRNQTFTKSFFTGLLSILLPCGLLYGIVLGTVALQHTSLALLSMFFFWLGTVPSMVVAPGVIRNVLSPLRSKLPKTYALSLVAIGVLTITFRLAMLQELQRSERMSSALTHRSCH